MPDKPHSKLAQKLFELYCREFSGGNKHHGSFANLPAGDVEKWNRIASEAIPPPDEPNTGGPP